MTIIITLINCTCFFHAVHALAWQLCRWCGNQFILMWFGKKLKAWACHVGACPVPTNACSDWNGFPTFLFGINVIVKATPKHKPDKPRYMAADCQWMHEWSPEPVMRQMGVYLCMYFTPPLSCLARWTQSQTLCATWLAAITGTEVGTMHFRETITGVGAQLNWTVAERNWEKLGQCDTNW